MPTPIIKEKVSYNHLSSAYAGPKTSKLSALSRSNLNSLNQKLLSNGIGIAPKSENIPINIGVNGGFVTLNKLASVPSRSCTRN